MMVKFKKVNFLWVYLTSYIFPVEIILVQHAKWLKLFIYSVNLPLLTLPAVFVHKQEGVATKMAYV